MNHKPILVDCIGGPLDGARIQVTMAAASAVLDHGPGAHHQLEVEFDGAMLIGVYEWRGQTAQGCMQMVFWLNEKTE